MPKTRNAFAFREYYEIGLELIPQSKAEMIKILRMKNILPTDL